jgi:hypothetical protein
MTLDQLKAAQTAAGARYAAAVKEFHASFVDLAALDITLSNANIGAEGGARSFAAIPQRHEHSHPIFAPHDTVTIGDEINAARDAYISEFTAG